MNENTHYHKFALIPLPSPVTIIFNPIFVLFDIENIYN